VIPGYTPVHLETLAASGAIAAGTLACALALSRLKPRAWVRLAAWLLAVAVVAGTHFVLIHEPAGLRMLLLCVNLLLAMKAIVGVESLYGGDAGLPLSRWLLWATCWPGMRPSVFSHRATKGHSRENAWRFARRGAINVALGLGLILAARLAWVQTDSRLLATLLMMPGLSLCLHFGLFDLLAGFWQWRGVDARPLFRNPPASTSLGEFWSKRWNLAFSEMVAISAYRPVASWFGAATGVIAGFALSGVLHEIAISLPVNEGYGPPIVYMTAHGFLVLLERRLPFLTRQAWMGRLWGAFWLLAPIMFLFHVPFLRGVIWPIIGMN
jgi:alginate O-acetyltransferase complex protein AlgI